MSNGPIILEVQCIACDVTLEKIEHKRFPFVMRSSHGRRLRTPNWSMREKQFLLELIKEKRDAVVPKNETASRNTHEKAAAWNYIMERLAAEFGQKFAGSTIKKVKTQWQNMKRVAREETTARVVSRQSMEVCEILEEQNQLKTEHDPGVLEPLSVKREPQDEDQPEFSITMDVTSGTATPPLPQDVADESSPCASALSEYAHLSEDEVGSNVDAPQPASSTSGYAGPSPPARARDMDFDSIATQSLKMKLELMQEERHVLRAMRQTADLNKLTAKKRLRQLLWVNRRERAMYSGEPGSGAGRGGGGGGAIREAGGSFGKMEAAREDEYFFKKQREQLASLKTHLKDEISQHEEQIQKHQEAIRRHREKVAEIEKSN